MGSELYSFPLPTGGGISGQYYWNKKVVADAGLDPNAALVTWQEVEEAARAVTVKDDLGLQVNFTGMGANVNNFVEWLHTSNGRLIAEDAKTIAFNSLEGVQTLEWMLNFQKRSMAVLRTPPNSTQVPPILVQITHSTINDLPLSLRERGSSVT